MIIITAVTAKVNAQNPTINAFGEGLSGTMSAENGLNSIGYNPAGIYSAGLEAGISYNSRFCMKELSQKSAVATVPVSKGCFGVDFNYFGFNLYNNIQTGLGYAMNLGAGIKAGIKINYHNIHIDDSPEKTNTMTGEIGVIYSPASSIDFGAYIKNPTNQQFSNCDTIIPVELSAGIKYKFQNYGSASVELSKNNLEDQIKISLGVQGVIAERVTLLGGISTYPFEASIGVATGFEKINFQMSFVKNEYLGWIPTATIIWSNKQKSNKK